MKPDLNPLYPIEGQLVDFPELWRTINEYKWGVLGIAFLTVLVAMLWAFAATPIYQGTTMIQLEPRTERVVQIQDVYDPGLGTSEYLGTQVEVLKSRDVAARVVDKLDLVTNPEFTGKGAAPGFVASLLQSIDWRNWLPFLPEKPAAAELTPEQRRDLVISALTRRLTVEPVARTYVMQLRVEALSPELAAKLANTFADVFIESGLEARLASTTRATQWLTDKLQDINRKLEQSEQALQNFREQQQLVNVGGVRNLIEEEMLDQSRRLREAQKRKTELANTYWPIEQAGNDDRKLEGVSGLLLDPLVQRAKETLLETQQHVKQLQDRYGEKHPQMSSAQARLSAAQAAYSTQLRLAAQTVKAEYEIARENERALISTVENSREQIRRLDRKEYQASVLEREVQTNRELYDLFLKRFKETDTSGSYEQLNARVVDPAVPPRQPFKPAKRKILVLSAIAGLLLGLILATLRHLLREGLRTAEEVEQITGLPVFGVLPFVRGLGRKQSLPQLFRKESRTPFAEGIRSVRAGIRLSDVDKRIKRIVVTSSLPSEGKSSIAGSLALSFAAFEQVLLIEADLRAPTLRKLFDISPDRPGLMELLTGEAKLEDCVHKVEGTSLTVLPVSKIPANPAEVVASAAMEKLVTALSGRFDRVIFDSAPALVASDTAILSRLADAVLLVVRSEATNRRAFRNAVKQLQQAKAPLFGSIFNWVDTRRGGYYSGYYLYGYYGKP